MKTESFFNFYLNKTGGLYDPLIVIRMIEALKEWLPEEEELRGPIDTYASGWNDYRDQILENLK